MMSSFSPSNNKNPRPYSRGTGVPLAIFDFDGVLADSFSALYELNKEGAEKAGIFLTPDGYRDFFMGNAHQGFKDFFKDGYQYSVFINFKKENFNKRYGKVRLFKDAKKTVRQLSDKFKLAIASSTQKEYIQSLLKKNGLAENFDLIFGNDDMSKGNSIRKIIELSQTGHLRPVFVVSDTVGDILLANKMGLRTIAVTWGFHSPRILKKSKPCFLVNSFDRLLALMLDLA